jgi:hypothetical protein
MRNRFHTPRVETLKSCAVDPFFALPPGFFAVFQCHYCVANQNMVRCNICGECGGQRLASPKFLLRRALACAKLARETSDEACRARCLRLEQVYRRLAQGEGSGDVPPGGPGEHEAMAS